MVDPNVHLTCWVCESMAGYALGLQLGGPHFRRDYSLYLVSTPLRMRMMR